MAFQFTTTPKADVKSCEANQTNHTLHTLENGRRGEEFQSNSIDAYEILDRRMLTFMILVESSGEVGNSRTRVPCPV